MASIFCELGDFALKAADGNLPRFLKNDPKFRIFINRLIRSELAREYQTQVRQVNAYWHPGSTVSPEQIPNRDNTVLAHGVRKLTCYERPRARYATTYDRPLPDSGLSGDSIFPTPDNARSQRGGLCLHPLFALRDQ